MKKLLVSGMAALGQVYKGSRQPRWAMASQVVTSGANFVTAIIVIRALGLAEFGQFSVCFLLIMISRMFLNGLVLLPMSTIGPTLRRVSAPAYRGFLSANNLAFAVVSSLCLFVCSWPIGMALNMPWLPELALPMAAANFAANGSDFIRRFHFVFDAPTRAFQVDAARFSSQVLIMLLMVAFASHIFSVSAALYAIAAGSAIGWIAGQTRYGRVRWSWPLSAAVWPRHANFIKWMTPTVVLEAIQGNAPIFIAGSVLGEASIGLLRAMQQLANILNLPFNALMQIAPSMAARVLNIGGRAALKAFLFRMTSISILVLLLAFGVVLASSDFVMRQVIHVSPTEALPIFLGYCLLNLAIILRFPLVLRFQVVERPVVTAAANVVGVLLAVLTAHYVIGMLGPVGAPLVDTSVVIASSTVYMAFAATELRKANWAAADHRHNGDLPNPSGSRGVIQDVE